MVKVGLNVENNKLEAFVEQLKQKWVVESADARHYGSVDDAIRDFKKLMGLYYGK